MSDLVSACLAVTDRAYPAGYGFALTYLDDRLEPAVLRDAACHMVGKAYGPKGTATDRKDPDLVAFVTAYAEGERFEHYLIEAAQLLLSWGMAGDPDAKAALAALGHLGY